MSEEKLKIPENWLALIQNEQVAFFRTRECDNCKFYWRTAEIPVWGKWDGNPAHLGPGVRQGEIHHTVGPRQAASGSYNSHGMRAVVAVGGIYRRRSTPDDSQRWTTGEFLASGEICDDIRICPQCGTYDGRVRR